ncbi:protein kinase domain-containing protein [Spirosoma telluris]|uniref:protein kinase domain-containing protein n=1 Tax=Spirosoma telluris TaxID=2183553 RepID=UPI002FC27E57
MAKRISRHRNIARYDECYRLETDTGVSDFAIMKYYPDGNLADLLKKNELSVAQIYDITKGILQGLRHLHQNRIVHRDFKPANILMARDEQQRLIPKIADFGLSKLVSEDEIDSSDFDISDGRGTASYKAPEQIEGGRVSFNLDLWAFGVILFELLTGRKPFSADGKASSEQAVKREIEKKIVSVAIPARIQQIPEPYQAMIKRCLVKDIHKRARKEDELLDLLDAIPTLFAEANRLVQQKKFAEAIVQYEAILQKREGNQSALLAIKTCKEAIENARIDSLLQEASRQLTDQQYAVAIGIYKEVLATHTNHQQATDKLKLAEEALVTQQKIAALLEKARTYSHRREFLVAKTLYLEIQQLDPLNGEVDDQLRVCNEGIVQQQIEQLEKQANALFAAQDFSQARKVYEEILQIDPLHVEANQQLTACDEALRQQQLHRLFSSADASLAAQHYDKAIRQYQDVLAVEPTSVAAQKQIKVAEEAQKQQKINQILAEASAFFARKQYDKARAQYNNVLAVDPLHTVANQQLAACQRAEQQQQIADWLKQANTFLNRKKYAEAQAQFEQVLAKDNTNETAQQGLVRCLEAMKPVEPLTTSEKTDAYVSQRVDVETDALGPKPLLRENSMPTKANHPLGKTIAIRALPYVAGFVLLAGGYTVWRGQIQKLPSTQWQPDSVRIRNTMTPASEPIKPMDSVHLPAETPKINPDKVRYDEAITKAKQALQQKKWPTATLYVKQALEIRPASQIAKELQTTIRLAQERANQQRADLERENQRQQAQIQYDNLLEQGIAAASKNNKALAISLFRDASRLVVTHELTQTKAKNAYATYLETGNRLLQLDEYTGAKAWFLVAQSLINTADVRRKIKECDSH